MNRRLHYKAWYMLYSSKDGGEQIRFDQKGRVEAKEGPPSFYLSRSCRMMSRDLRTVLHELFERLYN